MILVSPPRHHRSVWLVTLTHSEGHVMLPTRRVYVGAQGWEPAFVVVAPTAAEVREACGVPEEVFVLMPHVSIIERCDDCLDGRRHCALTRHTPS